MISTMKKISDINKGGGLQYIFGKLEVLKNLEKKISPCLPEDIRRFCRLANYENSVLKFAVPNSVWGTRLRYSLPELLKILTSKSDLPKIKSIEYYIEPGFDEIFRDKKLI
jgi:hypothetical protein